MNPIILIVFTAIALTLSTNVLAKPPGVKAPVVKAGDSLKITIRNEADLSGIFKVTKAGEINFPLLGKIRVAGMSTKQVARLMKGKLEDGYLLSAHVTVLQHLKPK